MRSSWSIHDYPPSEGETPAPQPEKPITRTLLTWQEKAAIRFEALRNRPNRKGRGARRRAGEKKWSTKGK